MTTYMLNNTLITDVHALSTHAIDGHDVQVLQESGYGVPNPLNPKLSNTSAITAIALKAVAGDIVAIVHPAHIIDDGKRLGFFTGLLEAGVMVACLTTGNVYGSGQPMDKAEATEAYTSWNMGANEIQKSDFRLP
ncbi:hypothetical protein QUC26_09390 [Pseudomonas asiatica]|uniref:hypothetical protein n=1 Tax=Pseudomonas asiatica TaxID=2219225 RepID=UPI0025A15FE8|nr:hypothetical protein [Pseudomonas asiatica]WJM55341.1 hypothetical protein QUC26_09390 [Pseudomonas asiatica]